MREAKIIATIGPASDPPDVLAALLDAGMDVARLNFSHGTLDEHAARIDRLRAAARQRGQPLTLLQDLQGPKIRTGPLAGGAPVHLATGARLAITTSPLEGTAERISASYPLLPRDVQPGSRILISDGALELRVVATSDDEVLTEVVAGGELRPRQGMNLPRVSITAPALTEKDIADLDFGLRQGVDWVALSFVRRAEDVRELKRRIAAAGRSTPVMAKIEKPEALDDMPAILAEADGIMVARGDLGVELPLAEVPLVQKQLIAACNDAGKPVVTATQMLESMIRSPRPTRAEASDVANAILDGTDAVMLSGETAVGDFPVEAVRTMATVANVVEAGGRSGASSERPLWQIARNQTVSDAICEAAAAAERVLDVRAIVAYTQTGNTARLVSRLRPRAPILAFTPREETARRINLYWGVTPVLSTPVSNLSQLGAQVSRELTARGVARPGDMVVMTGGHPLPDRTGTNFLKVVEVEGAPDLADVASD
ncbi:MAG TPA: pyruvate kinase [Chloroflexota bacterium]|nr:pyruvate kinase [Chloroflexota bacterium]